MNKHRRLLLLVAAAFGGQSGHAASPSRCFAFAYRHPDWAYSVLALVAHGPNRKRPLSQRQNRKNQRRAHAAGKRNAFA